LEDSVQADLEEGGDIPAEDNRASQGKKSKKKNNKKNKK
jgi:hypothetical protein